MPEVTGAIKVQGAAQCKVLEIRPRRRWQRWDEVLLEWRVGDAEPIQKWLRVNDTLIGHLDINVTRFSL